METTEAAAPVQRVGLRQIFITLCATLATAVYAFTWNSVTVALPRMQGAFSATTDQITWVMISFVIGSAAMTASVGFLSDRFGRKEVFLTSVAGFLVTLVACAVSSTLEQMVFWRFVQGVFGAGLLPLGQVIAVNAFPPDRHGQATALWALGFVTANVISPAVSGVVVEELGWPWIFYLPLPLGAAVLVASWFLVPRVPRRQRDLSVMGFSALIVGVSVLQLMLARGERLDWFESTEILIEAMVAGVALYWFIFHTLSARNPFFSRELFRNRNYTLGVTFIFIIGSVLFLPLLLIPIQLQQIGGYPAIDTGYLLLSRGVGSVLGLIVISRFRDRTDPRPLLLLGLLGTGLSSWAMSGWTVEIRPWDVIWTNFVHGVSTGAIWAPLNTLTLSRLDKRIENQGFAFFYLAFDIGSSIGTAAVVGLHARYSQINRSVLTEHITPFTDQAQLGGNPALWSITESSGLATLEQEVARQATMIAFNNSFMVIGFVLLVLIPFIALFRYSRPAAMAGS